MGSSQAGFLVFTTIVGAILRLINLSNKPPWTDEFATLVFSLGNDYSSVPLNRVMSLETLLGPLQPNLSAKITDVISLVIHQDNHPPLYFVLAHLWLEIFPHSDLDGLLWYSRALAVFFGVISIPTVYLVMRAVWSSSWLAQLGTLLMTFSPYAIFLSQEARQYSMAILLVLLSLGCLLQVIKEILTRRNVNWWSVFAWAFCNIIGLMVHYFFVLTLLAEFLTLLFFSLRHKLPFPAIARLIMVVGITSVFGLAWLYLVVPSGYGHSMTSWIHRDNSDLFSLFKPLFQILATWITMLCLLPVESPNLLIVIISGLMMGWFLIWSIPPIYLTIKNSLVNNSPFLEVVVIFILSVITIFFVLTYVLDIDITRGARYSFVYFPAVIMLIGIGLRNFKNRDLLVVFLVGFCSAITIVFNLGYQKYYRPDLFLPILKQNSQPNIARIIASPYKSIVETGEMMGIAWVLKKENTLLDSKFLLVNNHEMPENWNSIGSDFDLWLINFKKKPIISSSCLPDEKQFPSINGYGFKKYHCKS